MRLPLLTVFVAVLATPLLADRLTIVAPVFSQLVAFNPPDGFQDGFEGHDDNSYLHEIVPVGESVDAWSQMITLSGARAGAGTDAQSAAQGFAQQMADGYHAACPDSFTFLSVDAPEISGATATGAVFLGCGSVNGGPYSEQAIIAILVGDTDLYTLQWAERGPASPAPLDFDADLWLPRLTLLAQGARICDRVAGEEPPYPSCTE